MLCTQGTCLWRVHLFFRAPNLCGMSFLMISHKRYLTCYSYLYLMYLFGCKCCFVFFSVYLSIQSGRKMQIKQHIYVPKLHSCNPLVCTSVTTKILLVPRHITSSSSTSIFHTGNYPAIASLNKSRTSSWFLGTKAVKKGLLQ